MGYVFFRAFLSLVTVSSASAASLSFEDKVENSLRTIIIPAYQRLQTSLTDLQVETKIACNQEFNLQQSEVKQAFAKVVYDWGYIQSQHIGAIEVAHHYNRLYFWPDKRGRLGKQLHRALIQKNKGLISADQLAKKSVALQGLNAFEWLLFKDLSPYDRAFICQYANTITTNMVTISDTIVNHWHNGAQSPLAEMADLKVGKSLTYDSPKDILQEIYRDIITHLMLIGAYKLAPLIVQEGQKLKWQQTEFWRSRQTATAIVANIEFIETMTFGLSEQTGFDQFIKNKQARIVLSEKFNHARQSVIALQNLIISPNTLVSEETQKSLKYAQSKIDHLRESIIDHLLPSLNIDLGFNALDGD